MSTEQECTTRTIHGDNEKEERPGDPVVGFLVLLL